MWVKGCSACGQDHEHVRRHNGFFICPNKSRPVQYFDDALLQIPESERVKESYWMVHADFENSFGGRLPEYGEIRIVTHAGKVTFVETTKKEKVE